MESILLYSVLGLGGGALNAGLALAIVVMYRGSGIINIGTGAMAMVAAYGYWSLSSGTIASVPVGVAFVLAMVVAVAMGVLCEYVVFRPLRSASPLAKLTASLGVLLIAQAGMILAFGNEVKAPAKILPSGSVQMLGGPVPTTNFILIGIAIAMAAGLAALTHFTRFGLSTRAAAENEVSAVLIGLSPNTLALVNTVMASLIAGVMGVLIATIAVLDPVTLPLKIVVGLAAALFARFASVWVALSAGVLIGIAENLVAYAQTREWFPKVDGLPIPGVKDVLIFVLMCAALFWRGASLPTRGEIVERRMPFVPKTEHVGRWVLILGIGAAVLLIVFPFDFRQSLVNAMVAAALILSLVVVTGFVGQVSVVQLAISGVAGFMISHLGQDAGIGFPWAPFIAIATSTVLGILIGFSALRVRGVSLAIVTLAAAVAIQNAVFANPKLGESLGGSLVQQPSIFGIYLGNDAGFKGLDGNEPSPNLGFLILIVLIGLCLLVANLRRSELGQRMIAVRSNERAAAAKGINVRNTKLTAFGIGSFIAGVAGSLAAYNFSSMSADKFSALTALSLIAFAYIGGITMVSGALFAGFISDEALSAHAMDRWLGVSGTWTILFGGIALVSTLIFSPDGVSGTEYRRHLARVKRRAAGLPHPLRARFAKSAAPVGAGPASPGAEAP